MPQNTENGTQSNDRYLIIQDKNGKTLKFDASEHVFFIVNNKAGTVLKAGEVAEYLIENSLLNMTTK